MRSFFQSSLHVILQKRVFLIAGVVTTFYLLLTIVLFNRQLVEQTVSGPFSLSYKFIVLSQLMVGYWQAFPLQQTLFLVLTALLIGLNLSLILYAYKRLQTLGKTRLSVGGTSLLAIVATGCPGCGVTLLSVLGPSTAPAAPFLHDWRVQIGIILLLGVSIIYNLKKLHKGLVCEVVNVPGLKR